MKTKNMLFAGLVVSYVSLLQAHEPIQPPPPLFSRLHGKGPHTIGLKAYNDFWVAAESGGGSYLIANRVHLGPWETFEVICEDQKCSKILIQADNGHWLSEDIRPLICNKILTGRHSARCQGSEGKILSFSQSQKSVFKLTHQRNGFNTLQTLSGEFLVANGRGIVSMGSQEYPGKQGEFFIKILPSTAHDDL